MSTPAEKANLARIRDNQRRSRARRKEYLHELEKRLRLCELQGIEASAEIQVAARKVAEENKKLRMLLNRHGIHDQNIDHYLISGIAPPSATLEVISHLQQPMPNGNGQTLDQLLEPRRPNCTEAMKSPLCPVPSNGVIGGAARTLDILATQASRETSVASFWDSPSDSPSNRSFPTLQSQGRIQPSQHYHTPNTTPNGSSKSDPSLVLQGMDAMMDDPRLDSSNVSPISAPDDIQLQHAYAYEMGLIPSPIAFTTPQNRRQKLMLQTPSTSMSSPITPTFMPTSAGLNGCNMTSDLISSMTGTDAHDLRAALEFVPGLESQMDNVNFMERYTAAIGL